MGLPSAVDPERVHHERVDPHRKSRSLSDIVLGGQDGLVNVLGVLLGVAAATSSTRVVLVAGLAAAFAESVSMAAVAFTTRVADGERYRSERAREYRHIEAVPRLERDEVRAIYAAKGFSGELLDRIVDTITRDKDVWVAVMMREEHELADVDRHQSARSAAIVGCASLAGSLVPLVPFAVLPVATASWVAVCVAAITLFAFGAYKAHATVGHPLRGGGELALIGIGSAFLGYVVGAAFSVPGAR
jgi:predicted membrane protein (TIGR00267 family)